MRRVDLVELGRANGASGLRRRLMGSVAAVFACLVAGPAAAETLMEAWQLAYQTNPTIQAQRARLRAIDEGVPQALSGWRPTVSVAANAGILGTDNNLVGTTTAGSQTRYPSSYGLTVTQPLFRGGGTIARTSRAEQDVQAERARLQAIEQQVLLDVGTVYMNVLRDLAVVNLNENNVRVIERQLEATQDRFSVGEVTRTDVSQAEARLATSRANLVRAEGDLEVSRAVYERLVGQMPGNLVQPSSVPNVPPTRGEAIEAASRFNPEVMLARFNESSAEDNIRVVQSDLYPRVDLTGEVEQGWDRSVRDSRDEAYSVTANLTVPLYQAGAVTSRVREAKQIASQRRIEVEEAIRQVVNNAANAWENLVAARAQIESLRASINAFEIALDGVQQEALVGTRTVLDVLDAEQELLEARVGLVRSQRDVAVAAFSLAAAVGGLTAEGIQLPVEYYNPNVHYENVRNRWIDFDQYVPVGSD